jgi:GDP-D-mannose dehydratase
MMMISRRPQRTLEEEMAAQHSGATGQDGAHLAEFLLGLGYTVHGGVPT